MVSKFTATVIAVVAWAVMIMFGVRVAMAADVTITLNDKEQAAFVQLLDLAAKQGGVQAAGAVAFFANKLQSSQTPAPVANSKPETTPAAPVKK